MSSITVLQFTWYLLGQTSESKIFSLYLIRTCI